MNTLNTMHTAIEDTITLGTSESYNDSIYSITSSGTSAIYNSIITTNGASYGSYGDITVSNNSTTTLSVKGDASISGKLVVGDTDVGFLLEKISERLAILQPNVELESRWSNLRELREEYMKLEAEIKEKEEIYRALKS